MNEQDLSLHIKTTYNRKPLENLFLTAGTLSSSNLKWRDICAIFFSKRSFSSKYAWSQFLLHFLDVII